MIQLNGFISRLLVLLGFCLVFGALFNLAGFALIKPLYGVDASNLGTVLSDLTSENNISILKFMQFLNTLGLFIFPGILFAVLFMNKPLDKLRLDRSVSNWQVLFIVLLYVSFLPLINLMVSLNADLSLPDSLSALENWMRNAEDKAEALTVAFLKMDGPSDLLFNIVLIGVLPAIGEELIFRGIIQRSLHQQYRNHHIGIWIAALLFSALHMQFYGFLPRLILGAFFGYLLVWTGSLWAPMIAHFLNNTSALLLAYYLGAESLNTEIDSIGTTTDTLWISALSLLLFSYLIYRFRHLSYAYEKVDEGYHEGW